MKIIIVILIFVLFGQPGLRAQTFDVSIDTIFLDIKNIPQPATRIDLTHAVKFNNHYYCYVKERSLYAIQPSNAFFLIFSDKGKITGKVEVPEEINRASYFDLFIRNDSLIAKTYREHESFYFDLTQQKWNRISEVDDRVYEDENFAITYLSFGEFGETTWFIDKNTRKEYILGANGTQINRLNGKYYVTGTVAVRVIEDPKQLKPSDQAYYYRTVEADNGRKFVQGTTSLVGSHTLYQDTTYSPYRSTSPNNPIITSFVANNQLFQLYSDKDQTYIGKIENSRLIPMQSLGKRFQPYNWYYSYRGENLDKSSRFIKFREENNIYGFLEIANNKIAIRYLIHNQDSLPYVGNEGFSQLLDTILTRPANFSMEQAVRLEATFKGTDMEVDKTSSAHNGYYPERFLGLDVQTKRFVKVEDLYITQKTEYLETTDNHLIKAIFLEWIPTVRFGQGFPSNMPSDKTSMFQQRVLKMKEIEQIVTEKTHVEPEKTERENGYIILSWTLKNGVVLKLDGFKDINGKNDIRMIINLV